MADTSSDPKESAPPSQMYPPLPEPDPSQAQPPTDEKQPLMETPKQGQQPPPYSGPPPQPVPSQTVTVVTQQPVIMSQVTFGESPVTYTDSDGSQVTTVTEYRSGMLTWLIFALVCIFTGCICFALIPFCIDATKDVYHINPRDGAIVGVYKRI